MFRIQKYCLENWCRVAYAKQVRLHRLIVRGGCGSCSNCIINKVDSRRFAIVRAFPGAHPRGLRHPAFDVADVSTRRRIRETNTMGN